MPNKPITKLEKKAWKFAENAHKGQTRKFSGLPYFDSHVAKVNGIVKLHTSDESLLCAALLHDVIEDCYKDKEKGYKDIKQAFGIKIAKLVMELTSIKESINILFNDSKADYLTDKMINMSDGALIVKLSDRLHNISDSFIGSENFRVKYTLETIKIITRLENVRDLNKIQSRLASDIKYKMSNVDSIFN